MFTGLIQKVGRLERLSRTASGATLTVRHDPWPSPLVPGESIAVNGVCLTVKHACSDRFVCDILDETLARSNLGSKAPGALLNLERALRSGDPIGGHLITGHVDGTGTLISRRRTKRDWEFEIGCLSDLLRGIVLKGSVACDGVSLTVARLTSRSFAVCLIPFTLEHTALGSLLCGAKINIETDLLGKYVLQYLTAASRSTTVTLDRLREAGFT